ncbi:MAG TPA: DNA polymerase III subunit gamma and tau [Kribbellaceae bacterium]|nr:DNA polymerase III subunit gamma and tau [Kribbellaceae bacterium]
MDAPLALYRRYRPDTFAEVIGQEHVTEPLRNALANNRVNHAYLFSGPRGCGKTTSARILARAINCEKGPAPEPCGECRSCQDLARGGPGSIDVIEIDAASHGGVDDARDLRERAFFAPVQSRFKIYIIDEAHMVTTQGFNALLKLVEEPPPHLKFIFATTEPDKVIGTIRSRTHHYPFRLVPPKVLAAYLAQLCEAEGVAIEPAVLPLVVRAGGGSVRDSLSVLDQLIGGAGPEGVTYALAVALLGFTPDSLLDAIVDGFAAHDSAAVFGVIDKVIETGQDPKRFAEDLLRRLRDLVIVAAVPTAITSGLIDVAEDQGERLQTQAAGLGAAELTRAADIVAAGLLEMRGATAPRLQLELTCAKVLLPGADDSTQGVHARLDRIERRMTLGGTTDAGAAAAPPDDSVESRAAASAPPSRPAAQSEPAARPGPQAQPAAAQAAPAVQPPAPAGAGGIGLADVRRMWPQVLQRVKERKKVTWVMLSQNAQVLSMDDAVLTIALSHAGVRDNFVRSGHDEILREALRAELLVDRRIEAVVDPSAASGNAPAAPSGGSSSGGSSSAWGAGDLGGPAGGAAGDGGTAGPAAGGPGGGAAPGGSAPSGAEQGRGSAQAGSAAGPAGGTPAPIDEDAPPIDEADTIGEDDVVLEDDTRSHTDLLRETLGAEVIDEQPN